MASFIAAFIATYIVLSMVVGLTNKKRRDAYSLYMMDVPCGDEYLHDYKRGLSDELIELFPLGKIFI